MMSGNYAITAHINILPSEILVRIFTLSKDDYLPRNYDKRRSIYDVVAVCTRWRQLALSTSTLWTNVDIAPTTPSELTQLSLQCSKDREVHVHVYEPHPKVSSEGKKLDELSHKIILMLRPHVHRIHTLQLQSYAYSGNFVGSVLDLWLSYGNPFITRSLFIHRPCFGEILFVDKPKLRTHASQPSDTPLGQIVPPPSYYVSQSKNVEQVLRSLTTLHMGGSVLPWDSSAYCNLVELKLQFVHCKVSASESQLAALLSASPGLVTLKLAYIPVTRARGWTQPSPVQLNCLKVLDVVNMEAGSLELLLPLFAVPESSDDLSVGVPFDQRLQNALETFFARSQITTLHCCRPNGRPAPSLSLLRSLACVETVLILDRLLLNENNDATSLEAPGLSLIPSLIPNVILVSCKVTFEGLKDLVEAHQIRNLRLQLCRLIYSAKDSQSLEDIQASLLGMYPDLKVSIEDRDSTYDHPVRRWDEYN